MPLPKSPKQWTKQTDNQTFLISTDNSLLSIPAINAALASDAIYWASPFPEKILQGIVNNSFCYGLYKTTTTTATASSSENTAQGPDGNIEQVGFARLATDWYTFAYLTDVYILPEYQGFGLGGWLLDCVDELVREMPYLRWFILRTGSEKSVKAYERRMGMEVLANGEVANGTVCMGRRGKGNLV
ncbi:hypothetical protein ASPSYDRAFT_161087 [Aspergillus sydowii CBS 593.65]|uniref:N-acetyltransferase domain-containing protein n=1 Tax=Aspergillus sydowii CBS 593.65 TaxID=1036612 RepID=A0A1L9T488_9EURO|nr:uncharacterized protein ASPSYDRAFT_161087 [Aspergillus sydowii CBS 593.65]OJJ54264.1 hypothetical protein ASPSYDRAFT_161087 [Aspergillus sydowii CBS 593.65]